jgi:hypothetical protein
LSCVWRCVSLLSEQESEQVVIIWLCKIAQGEAPERGVGQRAKLLLLKHTEILQIDKKWFGMNV